MSVLGAVWSLFGTFWLHLGAPGRPFLDCGRLWCEVRKPSRKGSPGGSRKSGSASGAPPHSMYLKASLMDRFRVLPGGAGLDTQRCGSFTEPRPDLRRLRRVPAAAVRASSPLKPSNPCLLHDAFSMMPPSDASSLMFSTFPKQLPAVGVLVVG